MRKKLLFTFALLLTVATGAWATDWYKIQVTATGNIGGTAIPEQSFTYYSTLPCSKTLAECYEKATGGEPSAALTVSSVNSNDEAKVSVTSNNWNTTISINEACTEVVTVTAMLTSGGYPAGTVYFAITATLIPSWESDKCTVMLDGGKLIVTKTDPDSETGTMEDYEGLADRGWNAYVGDITSIVIKNGVTSIGMSAFAQCAISSVTIPASVKTIGDRAFESCGNLATVTLNGNPYIGETAFAFIKDGATTTMNLTANSAGGAKWMTFYNQYGNFQADEGTQVFKAAVSETGTLTLREVEDKIVNQGEAVVLKSTDNPMMTLIGDDSADEYDNNDLRGVHPSVNVVGDGTIYVLNYTPENGVGFYKLADDKKLGIGKAYLEYDGALSNFFGFEDETTSVELKNGKMEELKSFFDLSGRKVMNPTKGLYIVNGKKVIIK